MALTPPDVRFPANGLGDGQGAATPSRGPRLVAPYHYAEASGAPPVPRWPLRTRLAFIVGVAAASWMLLALGVIALLR